MSNKIIVQLLTGAILVAGIFGLFNAYWSSRKFLDLEADYTRLSIEHNKERKRIETLETTLKWAQQELDSCVGKRRQGKTVLREQ